jgi:hypothetical protein
MNKKEVPISINLELETEDLDSKYMQWLLNNKLVELKEQEFVVCGKCGEKRTSTSDVIFCNNCGARLNQTKAITIKSINKINYEKLLNSVKTFLVENLKTEVSFSKRNMVVSILHNEKEVSVIFPEISSIEFLVRKDADHCIVVYLDPRTNYGSSLFKNRAFYIGQFISLEQDKLAELLNALTVNNINEYTKAEHELNLFIQKLNSMSNQERGAKFETFVKNMLDGLKSILPSKLEHLRVVHPDDLYNSKIVNIGGAGYEDFRVINLYEYLSGIKPEKSGEAKCYSSATVTKEDFGEALRHALEDDILIVASTDDIAPSVWNNIINMKKQKGYYKYVIVDRKLLMILLGFLIEKNSEFLRSYY